MNAATPVTAPAGSRRESADQISDWFENYFLRTRERP